MPLMACCDFLGPYGKNRYYCRDCDADPATCSRGECGCADLPNPSPGQLELDFSDKGAT